VTEPSHNGRRAYGAGDFSRVDPIAIGVAAQFEITHLRELRSD
jgi:hypothetical protein